MNNRTKIILTLLISALAYSAIIIGIYSLQRPWHDILPLLKTYQFYIGLILTLGISFFSGCLSAQKQFQINRYILQIVLIIVISIGTLFIILSYNSNLWTNIPYNVSAFGAGVSVIAVGLAFLFALYPLASRRRYVEGGNIERLNKKIKELSKEADRIEEIAKDCKALVEELKMLREEEPGKNNQTEE